MITPTSKSPPKSVLVVDGDLAVGRLVAAVLRHAGFDACTQEAAAVKRLDDPRYAAIIRDFNLVSAERDEALRQLASLPAGTRRRTIVLTTLPTRAAKHLETLRLFAVIGKPFDLDDLIRAVTECVSGGRGDRNDH